jgi:chorismate dehydratase
VPSKINRDFHSRKVDFAFISSITSKKSHCSELGIIARKDVLSVLLIKGENKKDSASQTSNRLAEILGQNGEVIIGDKALQIFFNSDEVIDLALEWNKRFNLPFVFAKFCFHKNLKLTRNISKKFKKEKTKIPYFIMKRNSQKLNLSFHQIRFYLSKIDYFCDRKTKKGLEKFLKL